MYARLYHLVYFFLLQRLERLYPLRMIVTLNEFCQRRKTFLTVGKDCNISLHVLVNLRRVNVKMDYLGLLCVCIKASCYSVGETHTYCYKYITFLLFDIRSIVAVHTEHAYIQRMVGW